MLLPGICNKRTPFIQWEISPMNIREKKLTDAELWVLYLMATEGVSLKKIKDAVQSVGRLDKLTILASLRESHTAKKHYG